MKKFFSYFLILVMTLSMGVSFTACGNDDDENQVAANNPFIGSWKYTFGSGYIIYTFYADGTGGSIETDLGSYETDEDYFTYNYNNNRLYIRWNDDYETESFQVYSISNNQIIMEGIDDEGTITLRRL